MSNRVLSSSKCWHVSIQMSFALTLPGPGAVMVIESLNLAYHLSCFRCSVCQWPLGSGHTGTDVRVRVSKLHCAHCYSNDEGIWKCSVCWLTLFSMERERERDREREGKRDRLMTHKEETHKSSLLYIVMLMNLTHVWHYKQIPVAFLSAAQ